MFYGITAATPRSGPEALRYCRVPRRSTRAPPQKPEGGHGGTRTKAATSLKKGLGDFEA